VNNSDKERYLDYFGLVCIGAISFGYVVFIRPFAELHIQFPFLDFPIFIGEILLFSCLLLFLAKRRIKPQRLKKEHYLIICYFVFIMVKALFGYFKWGPLALRHAALFYYPAFIIFGYYFFRSGFFNDRRRLLMALLILLTFFIEKNAMFWPIAGIILTVVLAQSYSNKIIKYSLLTLLLCVTPYVSLFYTARTMLVGHLVSFLYLVAMWCIVSERNRGIKWATIVLIILLTTFMTLRFSSHNDIKSLLNIVETTERISGYYKMRKERLVDYQPVARKVRLYFPDKEMKLLEEIGREYRAELENELRSLSSASATKLIEKEIAQLENELRSLSSASATKLIESEDAVGAQLEVVNIAVQQDNLKETTEVRGKIQKLLERKKEISVAISSEMASTEKGKALFTDESKQDYDRHLDSSVGNMAFRLFIWSDMLAEFSREKPILGFDLGKPLRSPSLEVGKMASGEWERDGWIGAHNSFLHILYRTGIVGILFIVFILSKLLSLIKSFIKLRLWTGILLCAIIIKWFVAANFLLIFELPYTAIPIWSLFGMTLAYCQSKVDRDMCEQNIMQEIGSSATAR